MTQTQQILHNFLLLSIGGTLLSGCGGKLKIKQKPPTVEEGLYCMEIDEGAECPSVESINESMPYEPYCGTIQYTTVTAFKSHSESAYVSSPEMDINDDSEGDTCCYTANYITVREYPDCVHGRPYMQEEGPVVAHLKRQKGSWRRNEQSIIFHNTSARRQAGTFYLESAQYEHASVASFNRFVLELMKFGAPAHLIQQAQLAAMDEIRHAQSAFAIANELLNDQFQPDKMDLTMKLADNLYDFAAAVLEEAAINETLAVLLAAEQLRIVTCPMIKEYLQEVVREESQHSELAFMTLRWCIEKGGEEIRSLIEERLHAPIQISTENYPTMAIPELGLPAQHHLERVIQNGIQKVIIPSLQSLLV